MKSSWNPFGRFGALLLFALCMATPAAHGEVTETTVYRPFLVHGKTAKAIYKSVVAHSRKKGSFRTYATTEVNLRPKLRMSVSPKCKVSDMMIHAQFIVRLPQLGREAALEPGLRRDWQDFAEQLKRHENHHREIWLGCAKDMVSAAKAVPPSDCTDFMAALKTRIREADQACRTRNEAFDDAEQGRLPTLAFIRRVLASP